MFIEQLSQLLILHL